MGGSAFCELLIPEPFTLNRETGAKGEVSRNQGSGYGIRGSERVGSALRTGAGSVGSAAYVAIALTVMIANTEVIIRGLRRGVFDPSTSSFTGVSLFILFGFLQLAPSRGSFICGCFERLDRILRLRDARRGRLHANLDTSHIPGPRLQDENLDA